MSTMQQGGFVVLELLALGHTDRARQLAQQDRAHHNQAREDGIEHVLFLMYDQEHRDPKMGREFLGRMRNIGLVMLVL